MLCTLFFYGCAPHYYYFELLEKSIINNETNINIKDGAFYAMHLPGNKVSVSQNLVIVNPQKIPLEIANYSFKINSTIFTYEWSKVINNSKDFKKPGEGTTVFSNNKNQNMLPFTIKAKDSVNLTVFYNLNQDISEEEFKNIRIGEELTLEMNLQKNRYRYRFKAKSE